MTKLRVHEARRYTWTGISIPMGKASLRGKFLSGQKEKVPLLLMNEAPAFLSFG